MTVLTTVVCSGAVSLTIDGAPTCSTAWTVQPAVQPFNVNQIDPALAAQFFGAGFALFIIPWAFAFAASSILSFIRSL